MTTTTQERLEDLGFTPAQIYAIETILVDELTERTLPYAAELVHRIFLRVDKDSSAGRALSRALGFTNDSSLSRAARDFGVSKQYLHDLQTELEARVGNLAALAPARPAAPIVKNATLLQPQPSRVLSPKSSHLRS